MGFREKLKRLEHKDHHHEEVGFLMVDYPGYGELILRNLNDMWSVGENEGRPTPEKVQENMQGAIDALAKELGVSHAEMASKVKFGILGHSLGAAVGLQFAHNAAHPP